MPSKKKLERKVKRLKKESKQLWRDYKDLGDDYSNYVVLYHDILELLMRFDGDLLRRSVKGKLEYLEVRAELLEEHNIELRAEIAELKVPKTRAWINDEEVEFTSKAQ